LHFIAEFLTLHQVLVRINKSIPYKKFVDNRNSNLVSMSKDFLNFPEDNFSKIYCAYYPKLKRFAKEYVVYEEDAENIVQDIFMYLWENSDLLTKVLNLNAYLFTLIKHKCIDFLRGQIIEKNHNKTVQQNFEIEFKLISLESFTYNSLSEENIDKIINDAIDSLPVKCREIFIMSRMDMLKYREIAAKLNISINTVENQMSIALHKLKIKLKNYITLFITLFMI